MNTEGQQPDSTSPTPTLQEGARETSGFGLRVLGLVIALAALAFLLWATWDQVSDRGFSFVIVGQIVALLTLVLSVYILTRSILQTELHSQRRLYLTVQQDLGRLQEEAIHDHLTGLYNRRFFEARLQEEMARSARYGRPLAILLIDVDHLKYINDKLGHGAGDQLLKVVASSMTQSIRNTDLAARYAGDEFTIILPETDSQNAMRVAERLIAMVKKTSEKALPEGEPPVTVSIGIADRQEQRPTIDALIAVADIMMYKAKTEGGGVAKVAGRKLFGEYLTQLGLATLRQVEEAITFAQSKGILVGQALEELGFVTEEQVNMILLQQSQERGPRAQTSATSAGPPKSLGS
ncbi:MAG: GGDEF domain-containing protein [Chloroflexi bacterium]|nr:GGDEF domain-containing protein [Chloroflexota bacterium]